MIPDIAALISAGCTDYASLFFAQQNAKRLPPATNEQLSAAYTAAAEIVVERGEIILGRMAFFSAFLRVPVVAWLAVRLCVRFADKLDAISDEAERWLAKRDGVAA